MKHSLTKLSTILFFILILISCTHKNNEKNLLYKVSTINIAIDDSTDNTGGKLLIYVDKSSSNNYLCKYNNIRNSWDIYNLTTKKLFKIIRFNNNLLEYNGGLLIQNFNKIFAYDYNLNKLIVSDTSGKIYQIKDLSSMLKDNNTKYEASSICCPIGIYQNSIFMEARAKLPPRQFYFGKCLFIYDLKKDTSFLTISFPNLYKYNKDFGKYAAAFNIVNNQLIYSFEVDPNLYIYDLQGNLLKSINAKSNFLDKFDFLDSTKEHDIKSFREFNMAHGSYFNLIYDKYNKLFYRIIRHNMPLTDKNNKINDFLYADFSIIILDKDLNIITEQFFKGSIYDFSNIIPTNMGLLISKNPKLDREHIAFDIYKFKKD